MNDWHLAQLGPASSPMTGFEYYGSGRYVPHSSAPGSVSQQINVTPGQAYILTFLTYFASCTGQSTIEVTFGDSLSSSITDCQFAVATSHNNTINFVAKESTAVLMFSFEDTAYYTGGTQTMIVADGMYMSRANPSCEA